MERQPERPTAPEPGQSRTAEPPELWKPYHAKVLKYCGGNWRNLGKIRKEKPPGTGL